MIISPYMASFLSRYNMNNYSTSSRSFIFNNGVANMLSFTAGYNDIQLDQTYIPESGSSYSLSLQITPPYSFISGKDMSNVSDQEKYKWIELHKWTFKTESYFPITRDNKMVLAAKFAFGYLGHFNNDIGPSPFETIVWRRWIIGIYLLWPGYYQAQGIRTATVTP